MIPKTFSERNGLTIPHDGEILNFSGNSKQRRKGRRVYKRLILVDKVDRILNDIPQTEYYYTVHTQNEIPKYRKII